ncbi:MAG: 2-hydroxyacid dehydrogenase [Bacteroidetes bacterium]|nr:2-hydroxyacid dehydrogenase [Bacteroidota bacterium]
MKVLVFSAKKFEIPFLEQWNTGRHQLTFIEDRLCSETAMKALGYDGISIFSADDASPNVLEMLKDFGVQYITLRSAGYDNIQLSKARKLGLKVANVPDYSPFAIAEHAITLLLAYNRKIVLAQEQIKQRDFTLDSLVGFDLNKKKVGILGTGKIGSLVAKILYGFGCVIYANDTRINPYLKEQLNVDYISKDALCNEVDILIVCLPLTSETHHLIDDVFLQKLKKDTLIVNVARGAIVKTDAILDALDNGYLKGYASDVYDKESGVFFYKHSNKNALDDTLLRLINHPRVLLTPHQAFATQEALHNIAETTMYNLDCWEEGLHSTNQLP